LNDVLSNRPGDFFSVVTVRCLYAVKSRQHRHTPSMVTPGVKSGIDCRCFPTSVNAGEACFSQYSSLSPNPADLRSGAQNFISGDSLCPGIMNKHSNRHSRGLSAAPTAGSRGFFAAAGRYSSLFLDTG